MYCILGLCFLCKGVCARRWDGHERREGRETLVGEVPAMGAPVKAHEQRGEGSEGKGPHGSARAGWLEMQPVVNTAVWAVTSSWESVPSGMLWGSSEPLGWAKPPLLLLEVSSGMHGWSVPAAGTVGMYQGWTRRPHFPRPAQHRAALCSELVSLTHLSHSQGRQDPSASVCPARHPHISFEAMQQPVLAQSLETSVSSLLCTVCRAQDARAATQAGQASSDAIIVPWYGAPPGKTAPAGLHARPVGGSGSGPEC